MSFLDFGREICCVLPNAERREWLVTNGLGGYASGTIAGLNTRCYHGLLIAALDPPRERTLLLTKLDETVTYDGGLYLLYTNRWGNGHLEPTGFQHLERFRLEGTTPVWSFACADALLEKRVWMQPEANTTYIRYDLRRAGAPLALSVKAIINYRDHHGNTYAGDWQMDVEPVAHGLRVRPFAGATCLYLLSDQAEAIPQHEWYREYFLSVEDYRGLDPMDDNLYAGQFHATLHPGESLTLVASTDGSPKLDGLLAYTERQAHERRLVAQAGIVSATDGTGMHSAMSAAVEHLVLAADQLIVHRSLPDASCGRTVIAGYPWFGDWGRDTMVSLPGLTLATGRPEIASLILRTFARFVDQGMLPNRFPDVGEAPEYNTADATLWYFEAIRAYYDATGDDDLLQELFPVLQDIIAWHQRGTRYHIQMDPNDGLLHAGEDGVQLTWMDAKVGDWVATPRIGKPVEINALWYHALSVLADFARRLGNPAATYEALRDRARTGFARFWSDDHGYCYDVIDGDGNDPALRPNQLLAVSLPHSPLSSKQQRAVVNVCARSLLTSHGLRSLAPDDLAYASHYGGGVRERDGAYHQGTVWSWLMGPFISAHFRVYGDREAARSFLVPFIYHLRDHGLGSVSEIFDGDPPFAPRGCIAQAWGVAELLRVWKELGDLTGAGESDVTQ